MKCSICGDDKHPQLFFPSERKKPDDWRRRCAKCMRDQQSQYRAARNGVAPPATFSAWRRNRRKAPTT